MTRIDRATRRFWKWRGRPVDLAGSHSWLSSVRSPRSEVGEDWLANAAQARGGELLRDQSSAGLLSSMSQLNGASFDASQLRPEIFHFYEQTAAWRLEVWTEWNPLFRPAWGTLGDVFWTAR